MINNYPSIDERKKIYDTAIESFNDLSKITNYIIRGNIIVLFSEIAKHIIPLSKIDSAWVSEDTVYVQCNHIHASFQFETKELFNKFSLELEQMLEHVSLI